MHSFPLCIHSHVTAKEAASILKIPTQHLAQQPIGRYRRLKVSPSEVYTLLDGIFLLPCNAISVINQKCLYDISQFVKPPGYHRLDFHDSEQAKVRILRW